MAYGSKRKTVAKPAPTAFDNALKTAAKSGKLEKLFAKWKAEDANDGGSDLFAGPPA